MSYCIALLTDFGHADPYVGQMKAVLLRLAPGVPLVDLCHEIRPHNVVQARFMLESSHGFFPDNTLFVSVVDPGVGTDRPILAARYRGRLYLAPDNGLLCFLPENQTSWWHLAPGDQRVSPVFHGRDIFAPLAARMVQGESLDTMGVSVPTPVCRENLPRAVVTAAAIHAVIFHVDRFGNCLLNLPSEQHVPNGCWIFRDSVPVLAVSTYAQIPSGELGLLEGSQGVMELAMNQRSCAEFFGIGPGDTVTLRCGA